MGRYIKVFITFLAITFLFSCGKTKDIEKRINELIKAKDYGNALSLIDERIKEDPSNKRYRFLKLKIYARSGNTDMAYDEFQKYYSLTGKIDKEVLKELTISSLTSFIAPYKFTSLINLAEMKNIDEEIKKLVINALSDKDDTVKVGALWVVGKKRIKEAEDKVIELLSYKNGGVVFNALWALGEIKGDKGKGVILNFVNNPKDEAFLPEAIIALAKYEDKSVLPYLKRYTNSTNKKVSTAALTVTEYLEKKKVTDVYNFYLSRKDDEALSFLYLIAGELKLKDIYPFLVTSMKEKSTSSKERVIRAIAEIEPDAKNAVEILKPYLSSKDNGERTQAYYALFKLGLLEKDAFNEGIKDKLAEVRRFSYLGLGKINDKESNEILNSKILSINIYDKIVITYALLM